MKRLKLIKRLMQIRRLGLQKQKKHASLIVGLLLSALTMSPSVALAEVKEAEQKVGEKGLTAPTLNRVVAGLEQALPEPEKPQLGDTRVVVQVRDGWQFTYHQRFEKEGEWFTLEMNQKLIVN